MEETKKKFIGVDFIIRTNRLDEKYKTPIIFRISTDIPTPPQIGSTVFLCDSPLDRLKVKDVELVVDYDSYWYHVHFDELDVSDEQLDKLEYYEPF